MKFNEVGIQMQLD